MPATAQVMNDTLMEVEHTPPGDDGAALPVRSQ